MKSPSEQWAYYLLSSGQTVICDASCVCNANSTWPAHDCWLWLLEMMPFCAVICVKKNWHTHTHTQNSNMPSCLDYSVKSICKAVSPGDDSFLGQRERWTWTVADTKKSTLWLGGRSQYLDIFLDCSPLSPGMTCFRWKLFIYFNVIAIVRLHIRVGASDDNSQWECHCRSSWPVSFCVEFI